MACLCVQEPSKIQLLSLLQIPHWDGIEFVESFGIEIVRECDGNSAVSSQLQPVKEWLRDITYGGFGESDTQDFSTVLIGDALNWMG
jgi:hypothetical protein